MLRVSALAIVASCVPTLAYAGGLAVPEPNAAALGRAGAAAASPDGASAIYYNPAALTLDRGLAIEITGTLEDDRTRITPAAGDAATTSSVVGVPSLFLAQRIGDHLAVGFGVYRALTQALSYPDSFADRTHVLRADFGGVTLQPTVAARPYAWISIGFGLTVTLGRADITQGQGDPSYATETRSQSHSYGIGAAVGVWARLYRRYLRFGASYRSAFEVDMRGRATTTLSGSLTPIATEDTLLTLSMPHQLAFALASEPRLGTHLQLETRVALLHDLNGFYVTDTQSPPNPLYSIPLQLKPLVQLRLGAEQHVLHERMILRLGVGYDLGAARRDLDPALPDGDRVVLAAGLGFHRTDFSLDAGYLVAFSPGRTGERGYTYAADYAQVRHTVAVTLAIRLGTVGPALKRFTD